MFILNYVNQLSCASFNASEISHSTSANFILKCQGFFIRLLKSFIFAFNSFIFLKLIIHCFYSYGSHVTIFHEKMIFIIAFFKHTFCPLKRFR